MDTGGAPLLCGIDVSTSEIRAVVFAPDGRSVASAAAPLPMRVAGPDRAELDAEAVWRVTLAVLRDAVGRTPTPHAVVGLAVASVGETGVLLAADGQPVAPMLAWYDARTTAELDALLVRVGFDQLHRVTGLCPDPTFGLLKLMWLKRRQPEAFAAGVQWLHVSDYLAWRLCGERATDFSLASRTMFLDLERRIWATSILEAAEIPVSLLPPLLPGGTGLGRLRPEVAAAAGLPPECVVGVGGHDHVCGLLAAGADRPGTVLDNIGTAEALTLVRDAPVSDPALGWDGYNQGVIKVDRPLYYIFGGLPTAAATVEWFRGLHGGVDHATLIAEAEAVPCGSDGVLFLPHLRLGSPPFPDAIGRGAFLGLSAATSRGAMFRALLEGLALDSASILRGMLRHLQAGTPERILAIGGSTRNPLLMRLKADLFQAPLVVLDLPDTTCLGAALLGGLAAGLYPDLDAARAPLAISSTTVPSTGEWSEAGRIERQAIYGAAYAALRPLHGRLLDR